MCEILHCQLEVSRTPVVRRPGRAVARRVRRSSTMLRGEIPADAPGDPCCGGLDRVARQVRISGGRLDLGVAQQFPDHREALAQGQRCRSKRMAKVMDTRVVEFRLLPDTPPGMLKVGEVTARLPACDHPRVVLAAGQGLQ